LGVDLVNDGVERLRRQVLQVAKGQTVLDEFCGLTVRRVDLPRTTNWKALRSAQELSPSDYQELLAVRGVGASAVNALAAVGEALYGTAPRRQDPVDYSFSIGADGGVPMTSSAADMVATMSRGIERAKLKRKEKAEAMARLSSLLPT